MINPMTDTMDKLTRLTAVLKNYGTLAVAFSGGVDSTFLLAFAKEVLGDGVFAVTAEGPNFSPDEMEEATAFCTQNHIRQLRIPLGESLLQEFSHNPTNRCYLCKKAVFSGLKALALENGASYVADGTNADDLLDYRPGLRALKELGIQSPLQEAGLTKEEIRLELHRRGLAVWNKPAFACLASRIPYGEEITAEKLQAIFLLERRLHQLGFLQCRVRHHGAIARIEVLPEDRVKLADPLLMDQINAFALEIGFTYAALDLAGYKMGSMNTGLENADETKIGSSRTGIGSTI